MDHLTFLVKKHINGPGIPFDPNADNLRNVIVYDRLDVQGLIRSSDRLKIGGVYTDDSMYIGQSPSSMSIVGKGVSPNRKINLLDDVTINSNLRLGGNFINFGSSNTYNGEIANDTSTYK